MVLATRWDVERAVLNSDLEAPARLVMLVLLAKADNDTAEIPMAFTPSLSTLAAATGLSRSTVAKHLDKLESTGWVKRTRPDVRSKDDRTQYAMCVGGPSLALVREADHSSGPGDGLVRDTDGLSSPGDGRPVVRETDTSSPGDGHASLKRSSTKISPTKEPNRRHERADTPRRPDVEQICNHLADRIESNGSKRPTITAKWRDSARLLIDRDGRPVSHIVGVIDWCQDDDFWRANILSMPKLREKYDHLRLAAQRPANGRASPNGNDIDWQAAMNRAQAREANP